MITTRQDMINRAASNRVQLLGSAILAKAALRMADGSIRIITVQELSTRYEFYQVYKGKAKTQRAPRKGWKQIQQYGRDINAAYKQYTDFKSFVAWYARINNAEVLTMRVLKVRRLAALLIQTVHESVAADWAPINNSTDPRDYRWQGIRLDKAISGRVVDESWRGR